jgi:transcriptional regulator with XRE-family HTH domain
MVDMTTFVRVKELCKERGITIVDLEEKVGFGRNSIYSWKKNKPSSDKLEKVADFFNVSTDYLLGRTDNKRFDEKKNDPYEVIAAHLDEDVSDKELEDIKNFIEFIKSKRK